MQVFVRVSKPAGSRAPPTDCGCPRPPATTLIQHWKRLGGSFSPHHPRVSRYSDAPPITQRCVAIPGAMFGETEESSRSGTPLLKPAALRGIDV